MLFILVPISIALAGVALAGRVVYKNMPKDLPEWDAAIKDQNFGPTFYQKALAAASVKSRQAVLGLSTKLVYKLKITSLKSDNLLTKVLNQIREHKANTKVEIIAEPVLTEINTINTFESKTVESFKVVPINEEEIDSKEEKGSEMADQPTSFSGQEQQYINQLAYNPKDVSVYKKLGWLYLENNMPIQARQSFKMAIKLGSKDKIIMTKMLEMGGVLHKEGRAEYNPPEAVNKMPAKIVVSKTSLASSVAVKKTKITKTRKLKITKV